MIIRKNDSGRSIVEMLGVLAIMGVITVMGITGYSQATEKINRNKTMEQVMRFVQEIRTIYASSDDFNGLSQNVIKGLGMDIKSVYGTEFDFTHVNNRTDNSTANPGFKITMTSVSKKDCIYFSNMSWVDAWNPEITIQSNSIYANSVSVNGTTGKPDNQDSTCTDGNTNTLRFYYR